MQLADVDALSPENVEKPYALDRLENARFAPGANDFSHNPMFIARGLRALHLEFDAR